MCGVTGFFDRHSRLNEDDLKKMIRTLAHRGPDDERCRIWRKDGFCVGLGHRRLSIIDLTSGGTQPMSRNRQHLVFNGEIYNYQEIRKELISYGYRFLSESDTEVFLYAYDKWGLNCVKKFVGMFAGALYDEDEEKIFLIRDRAGVKPLFYHHKNGCFLFGSELKALMAAPYFEQEISPESLVDYFRWGYIRTPKSIFKDCLKVPQGSILTYDIKQDNISQKEYWNVFEIVSKDPIQLDKEEFLDEVESILKSSCNYRMIADVPVGVFLSGGYDSTLITAMVQNSRTEKVKTFTIGFENIEYDESSHAYQISNYLGTEHYEMTCTSKQAQAVIPQLAQICDEPLGDSSIIPTYLVSKFARNEVKVVLSGDGGDEQFVGYPRYHTAIALAKNVERLGTTISRFLGNLGKGFVNGSRNGQKLIQILTSGDLSVIPLIQTQKLMSKEIADLLGLSHVPRITGGVKQLGLNSIFAREYQCYLQDDILTKIDRATMFASLEGREPLLDHRLAELLLRTPLETKYGGKRLKGALKTITHRFIPQRLMDRPKSGFSLPISDWLRGDLRYLLSDYLDKDRISRQGLFSYDEIKNHLAGFHRREPICELFIWYMIVFQIWYYQWMEN